MSADLLAGHLRAPQSLNRYAYARDPVNNIDPLGLEGVCVQAVQSGEYIPPPWCFDYDENHFGDNGVSDQGGGRGGSDDAGKKFQDRLAKQFLDDLSKCIQDLYGIELTRFQESRKGENGLFEGKDSKGSISVVNDVGSYTKVGIRFETLSFTAVGRTPKSTARNQTNYTASDLDLPEAFKVTQVHELAHSLDQIKSGSVFGSSEKSADRLMDCIEKKQQDRTKKK